MFREVYGKEYPKGTCIELLNAETSTFWENAGNAPGSTLMDIALRVEGTDYYHLECQMKNDHEMVIRMFAYDVHFAISHTKNVGGEHIYKIPTVKVQTYSLEDIKQKHLILFLPYTMLRFRPRLRQKKEITEKELTGYLEEVILILEDEVSAGNLTELQYHDYVGLIRQAAEQVFARHRKLWEEVDHMTKPLIKLPSVEIRELQEMLAKQEAENAEQKTEITKQKTEIAKEKAKNAKQETEIAKQETEIRRLQEMLRLAGITES